MFPGKKSEHVIHSEDIVSRTFILALSLKKQLYTHTKCIGDLALRDLAHIVGNFPRSEEMLQKNKILVPVLSIRSPLPKEAIGRTTMYMERLVFISFCEGE